MSQNYSWVDKVLIYCRLLICVTSKSHSLGIPVAATTFPSQHIWIDNVSTLLKPKALWASW